HHKMHGQLPDEEMQLRHLLLVDRFMSEAGFEHYEISNYARPGRRARHNLNYWKGASYLGMGPSAHSFHAGRGERLKNVSSLHSYGSELAAGRLPVEWTETLTDEARNLERWMLALRLDEGFPREWVADPARAARVTKLRTEGLIMDHPAAPDRLRLTARGFALSDGVIAALS
ncbi:MAG: hypothetical protein IT285_09255, partial [Bdellovibrionales bacterium]|nr:hypothetical protein [Bdellovibrionales bacterium]